MATPNAQELWSLAEEELLAGLGRSVSDGRLGLSPGEMLDYANGWLDKHRAEICSCLRAIPLIAQLVQDGAEARRLEALGAMVDFFALAYGKSTAAWAATFVLRVGLSDFCSAASGTTKQN